VYVGLGSNQDNPRAQLRRATQSLMSLAAPDSLRASRLYRSAPLGPAGQPDYLNAVVSFFTQAAPRSLLSSLQSLEAKQGRRRTVRWGPRTLDLDILLYDQHVLDEPDLQIPHPRIAERMFVLQPLQDLDPELEIPRMGPVRRLLRECPEWRLEALAWDPFKG
jgi:2-amino-4-hydroxy-6-hydroxymethyldihydropteridine diphosphokinase